MKITTLRSISLAIALGSLCACQAPGEKEAVGTLAGAAGGGVVGAQFGTGWGQAGGAAIGGIAGGLSGNAIGRYFDAYDARKANRAFERASRVPVGEVVYWNNTRTGNWGCYKPLREGHSSMQGLYCREYETTAVIQGRRQRVYGTACRQPNGTWELL
jgi:surface antigen